MFPIVTKTECLNIHLYDVRSYEKGKSRNVETCLYELIHLYEGVKLCLEKGWG